MALGNMTYDPQALVKGLILIQHEGMLEEYLKKFESMWMIATCEHDLSVFGDEDTASLIGFHWMEHLCPEIGDSSEFMQQAREMLFNSSFVQANEVDHYKRDHLLKEMLENGRAGWEMFYLLCRYLQIPAMFFLHQGVYVIQDGVFQPQDQRAIFVCGLMERLRVLRPRFHNLYGVNSWTTNPVKAREIISLGGGNGKGKKSSSGSKRKRQVESLIERSREILGELMEQQEDQPPAKRTSLSGDGESMGSQIIPPTEITMTTTAFTSGSVEEPMTVPAVSEGETVQVSTSRAADQQERTMITTVAPTTTKSQVSFVLGELHQEKGAPSQSSGASRESFLSREMMLIGKG